MQLIGISGKAGSGKDWLAKNVLRPIGYQNISFAWPLKIEAMRQGIGSFADVFIHKPARVRDWLQTYGVAKRAEDPDFWIKQLDALMTVLEIEGGVHKFVITDVRFRNELDYVRSKGGKLVRLEHGDRVYPLRGTMASMHSSETALDHINNWTVRITNGQHVTKAYLETALYGSGVINERPKWLSPVARSCTCSESSGCEVCCPPRL